MGCGLRNTLRLLTTQPALRCPNSRSKLARLHPLQPSSLCLRSGVPCFPRVIEAIQKPAALTKKSFGARKRWMSETAGKNIPGRNEGRSNEDARECLMSSWIGVVAGNFQGLFYIDSAVFIKGACGVHCLSVNCVFKLALLLILFCGEINGF